MQTLIGLDFRTKMSHNESSDSWPIRTLKISKWRLGSAAHVTAPG